MTVSLQARERKKNVDDGKSNVADGESAAKLQLYGGASDRTPSVLLCILIAPG